ncbi:MAG: serine/threonine protein kinase, partial [Planctomycetota bacterium]
MHDESEHQPLPPLFADGDDSAESSAGEPLLPLPGGDDFADMGPMVDGAAEGAAADDQEPSLPGGLDADPALPAGSKPVADPSDSKVERAQADPFIGCEFGGYQLVEQLGRGGMGTVYMGVQVSLERPVAVKLLNKALVDNQEFIKRFQREARAMATITHPNIVSVIDFGEQDGTWFMVAELVEGTNLARMIREQLMVPASEMASIMVQCLSALAHVAKSNVVHRDIKPDNILIDGEGVAKLADFGLAKDMSKDETELTAAGSAMGTPAYMSPEQCMGLPLDGRSDLYALGVTCYYALAGEKPFTGRSSFDVMTKQREYVPPPLKMVNPQVPEPISDLVEQMMAKQVAERFISAEACRDAWVAVSRRLGFVGSVTRSGEFLVEPSLPDMHEEPMP